MQWPKAGGADTFAPIEGAEPHRLEVTLVNGRPTGLILDGESVFPTWFKLEFKENGEVSAKAKGVKLSTRLGDTITIRNA